MGIYLKKFETISQYNAYTADTENFILPNVSLTVDNNTVHYNPSSPVPPTPSHDYVEIGGVKWATMNVGANSITDTGLYFQWGDTQGYTSDQVGCEEGKKCFDDYWSDYKWTEDGGETFTKYNGSDYTVLQPSDDAVTVAWGGSWRMPTTAEYAALGNAVNSAWTTDYQGSGVSGLVCTDKTDSTKKLFFPAAGYANNGGTNHVGNIGNYWSSSLDAVYGVTGAYYLFFVSDEVGWRVINGRYYGYPVRGVLDDSNN